MEDIKNGGSEHIAARIHKNFYFNDCLEAATLIKEYDRIEKMLVDAQYIACLTIQVDQLKRIEYLYGSQVYTSLLTQTVDLIKEMRRYHLRGEDILVIDLFDQDTFIVFLAPPRQKNTQILDHLETIAERVRNELDRAIFNLFYPYSKEYSKPAIGYGLIINNPMISNMRLIMQMLANSKKMGEFMALKHEHQSRYNLQKLLIEGSIQTVFQPIVTLEDLSVIGYEALSRGPQGTEFQNPLLLFVLASEYGLSFELDSLCRRKAFEAVHRLPKDKKIFVNTLAQTIHDPDFRGRYLEQLLDDIKIKPENVIFEINEKMAIDNYDLFRNALRDYSDIGIVHASDDIGSGYSNLERIMELNPGFMKIDISLVRDIHKSYIKQQIIRAMVTLSKSLDSQIIAEGIETREEYETLLTLGVTYGQGYLFGRPSETLEAIKRDFLK